MNGLLVFCYIKMFLETWTTIISLFNHYRGKKKEWEDFHRLEMFILSLKNMTLLYNMHIVLQTNCHLYYIISCILNNIPLEVVRYIVRGYQKNPFHSFLSFNLSWFYKSIGHTWWDSFYKSKKKKKLTMWFIFKNISSLRAFFLPGKSVSTFTSILSLNCLIKTF